MHNFCACVAKHTHTQQKKNPNKQTEIEVIPHEPPDWSKMPIEKAKKITYDYDTDEWQTSTCKVKVDPVPFDCGGLRYVFHLHDLSRPVMCPSVFLFFICVLLCLCVFCLFVSFLFLVCLLKKQKYVFFLLHGVGGMFDIE